MNAEPWLSLEAIAEHLGVSTHTVHRRIRDLSYAGAGRKRKN